MNFLDPRLPDRFWDKVIPEPNSGCWLWIASTSFGYGAFGMGRNVVWRSHRLAYSALVGPIPDGLDLDHLCRTRSCCNPAHLEPVTRGENVRRGLKFNRASHCPKGHEFTAENTNHSRDPDGYLVRQCRECNRQRCAAWTAQKKAS